MITVVAALAFHVVAGTSTVLATSTGARLTQAAPFDESVVASAGPVTVTRAELRDVIRDERVSGDMMRLASASTLDGIAALSRRLLEQKILANQARTTGIHHAPDVVRTLSRTADGILAEALIARELAALDTSDAALRRFYSSNLDRFRSAPRRKARHIVVASRDEALAAFAELRAGADFVALAKQRNTDATRATGGELGWVAPGVMVKTFDAALFTLPLSQTSEPVQTSFGWHLIHVDEIDPGALPPFELASERVLALLREDAVARLKAKAFESLIVTIDREALGGLVR